MKYVQIHSIDKMCTYTAMKDVQIHSIDKMCTYTAMKYVQMHSIGKMCSYTAMKYVQIYSIVINTCTVIKSRDIYPQIEFARKVTRCYTSS